MNATHARPATALRQPDGPSHRPARARSARLHGRVAPPQPAAVIDLRAAAAADRREQALAQALDRLAAAAADHRPATLLWPDEAGCAYAARALGMPLAVAAAHAHATATGGDADARVTVDGAVGSADAFLTLAPRAGWTFRVAVCAEEAALRWERAEPAPARRLSAAARLKRAGWTVELAERDHGDYPGRRNDRAELRRRAAEAGFKLV